MGWLGLACLVLTLIGCNGSNEVPVEGSVTVEGSPAEKGGVTYHPDSSRGNTLGTEPAGVIHNGKYALETQGKAGAPPGWYKVTVSIQVPSKPKDPYSLPRSLVNEKYTRPDRTDLSVEVKPGASAGAYDLKLTR